MPAAHSTLRGSVVNMVSMAFLSAILECMYVAKDLPYTQQITLGLGSTALSVLLVGSMLATR